jgi:hypothetical protein
MDTTQSMGVVSTVTPGGKLALIHVLPPSMERSTDTQLNTRHRINGFDGDVDSLDGTAPAIVSCIARWVTVSFATPEANMRADGSDGADGAADGGAGAGDAAARSGAVAGGGAVGTTGLNASAA